MKDLSKRLAAECPRRIMGAAHVAGDFRHYVCHTSGRVLCVACDGYLPEEAVPTAAQAELDALTPSPDPEPQTSPEN